MYSKEYVKKYLDITLTCDPCDFANHQRLKHCFGMLAQQHSLTQGQSVDIGIWYKSLCSRICPRPKPRNGISKTQMIEIMKKAHAVLVSHFG